jgi:hypothetical protein
MMCIAPVSLETTARQRQAVRDPWQGLPGQPLPRGIGAVAAERPICGVITHV